MAKITTLRLLHLEVENIKRLKVVSITPDGNVIEITGKNRAGKTSLLDSLWWALTGTTDIQRSPIRDGEETARIHLDLGQLKITRKFTAKKAPTPGEETEEAEAKTPAKAPGAGYTTSLVVENEDGARYQSPQKILDALISELTIDPLTFTRVAPAEQFEMLKSLAPGVDFAGIEAANAVAYKERTDVNRLIKDAKSQANGIAFPADTPDAEIDEEALTAELQSAGTHNQEIEGRRARRESLAAEIVRERAEADAHNVQAKDYRRLANEAEAEAEELRAKADASDKRLAEAGPLPDLIDPSEISAKLNQARAINAAVRRKQEHTRLTKFVEVKTAEAEALTTQMLARDAEKVKAIAEAKIPVAGIGFGDGFVTLNGQPFEQASDAEQLGAAIEIAIAGNPKLRLVRVRDGSLLDADSWKLLQNMADKLDFQVLVETVSSDRPGAIVIEDGRVVGATEVPKVAAE